MPRKAKNDMNATMQKFIKSLPRAFFQIFKVIGKLHVKNLIFDHFLIVENYNFFNIDKIFSNNINSKNENNKKINVVIVSYINTYIPIMDKRNKR